MNKYTLHATLYVLVETFVALSMGIGAVILFGYMTIPVDIVTASFISALGLLAVKIQKQIYTLSVILHIDEVVKGLKDEGKDTKVNLHEITKPRKRKLPESKL